MEAAQAIEAPRPKAMVHADLGDGLFSLLFTTHDEEEGELFEKMATTVKYRITHQGPNRSEMVCVLGWVGIQSLPEDPVLTLTKPVTRAPSANSNRNWNPHVLCS